MDTACQPGGGNSSCGCVSLTGLTDGAAVVGFEGGVDAVGSGTVGDAAVHLPVGLAAAALTPGQLQDARVE